MEYTYVRYGQAQEPINAQYSAHSQYSSNAQPAQYGATTSFSNRSQYKTQPAQYGVSVQYDDGAQYDGGSQYEEETPYDDGSQYASVQYEASSSYKSGSQFNKPQGSWQTQQSSWQSKKYNQDDDYTVNSAPVGRGYSAKGYSRGSQSAGYTETFREPGHAYTKETRPRGRGSVPSTASSSTRGRSTYNSQGAYASTAPVATHAYEEKYASNRGAVKQSREPRGRATSSYNTKTEVGKGRFQPYNQGKFNEPAVAFPTKPVSIMKKPQPQNPSQRYSVQQPFAAKGITVGVQRFEDSRSPFMETSSVLRQNNGVIGTQAGEKKAFIPKTVYGGVRKKRRKTPAEKNMKLKKYVQPKNAVMCLNELVQGVVYTVEQESSATGSPPICVSVEVKGQKYKGIGSSKQIAKQAAAEAALVSFVKPPSSISPDDKDNEDNTPWAVLASFAMYKLFNEWREGRIGMCHPGFNANPFGMPLVQDATMSQTFQTMLGRSVLPQGNDVTMTPVADAKSDSSNIFAAYLGCKVMKEGPQHSNGDAVKNFTMKDEPKQVPNPAKQVPDNADSMHPVMLLHQMKPKLVYVQSTLTRNDQQYFQLSCDIDGKQFLGEGANLKKAKLDLAIKANKELFDVNTTYQPPAN